ncbi:TraR/DksA C4-type zinc finger protein [Streptomyces sp. MP131-18]|uniref:TraR/DksA family transcriptional regulator n=1 Tax=Streptomyces sp. MP131-18 TaxID=1857892 RepID=UPI00209AFA09|nr:TraR/DksA C4-type zinc finger protein [Streptomyces sp. MP131-18]
MYGPPRSGGDRLSGRRAGHNAGRPARPRCRASPVDLSFRSRFASKITLCEGAAAMVAAKKSARKTSQDGQTGAKKVAAKKSTADEPSTPVSTARTAAPADPGDLAVRTGEDPWTAEEAEEARDALTAEADRLRAEITASEEALTGLMRDSGDGAGDDQADTGTKNVTREHEMALASNAREMLYQTERALQRLEAGTYGLCENCGQPIGKARMQVFPRATLCVDCKQKQERRF